MAEHDSIHVLMGKVLAELPAIGKNQRNQQQGFQFRGIDDVLDALNPVLSKHGVYFVPDVVERLEAERPTQRGGVMYVVNLHVRFRFYGPAGDYVEASGWGEGTDSGDKATNKAMTGAMKYVLFQVFAISTKEASELDADRVTPEPAASTSGRRAAPASPAEGPPPTSATEGTADHKARLAALPGPARNKLISAAHHAGITDDDVEGWTQLLDEAGA